MHNDVYMEIIQIFLSLLCSYFVNLNSFLDFFSVSDIICVSL